MDDVEAAIAAFQVPDGYERYDVPPFSKYRSKIYDYGVRVAETVGTGAKGERKHRWYCMASESCRSANRPIMITANTTSSAIDHLKVKHGSVDDFSSKKYNAQKSAKRKHGSNESAHSGPAYNNNNIKAPKNINIDMSFATEHVIPPMTSSLICVATCNLNQWALDFDGNLERVERSIKLSKEAGATYRLGPELELSGYGCEDHFLESDTIVHCDESLAKILSGNLTHGIICDIGTPMMHNGVRYNCRVFCLNGRILLVRPKLTNADDGNYRESRYFACWKGLNEVEDHILSGLLQEATGQASVPFGHGVIRTGDAMIASETCEELWTPKNPHIDQSLFGVDITGNGSASHHQLRKLDLRVNYMISATKRCGGLYLYANQQGCDGGRLYYDGCAMIICNGEILSQATQFSVSDVEVVTAMVDLDQIRSYRGSCSSRMYQASLNSSSSSTSRRLPIISILSHRLGMPNLNQLKYLPTLPKPLKLHTPEEECALGPACWLWDYLRRSGARGFLLPLSGGADSSSTATIVGVMCNLVADALNSGDLQVKHDVNQILEHSSDTVLSANELSNRIMHTVYMATENSGGATQRRAKNLSSEIGSYHISLNFDIVTSAIVGVFSLVTGGFTPKFCSRGGTLNEDLALQNIQARLRMVIAYLFAQLLPWVRGSPPGFLLVLGSANVDEALRGYMTKYDCSSADLNPIGAISKVDLKRMLLWASEKYKYTSLTEIAAANPTAELRPISSVESEKGEHTQLDEEEMGMTYQELSHFGILRKMNRCGPVSMFKYLLSLWPHLSPYLVAEKVKKFFYFYGINRHKMTTLTPSYHAEQYSPDDNRFDLRQFLYNRLWTRQFSCIDNLIAESEKEHHES